MGRAGSMLACGLVLLAYVLLSVHNLECPGLGYDEVMWASVAVQDPTFSWVTLRFGDWPVLLGLPYVGAFKGYLYRPVLALFEPSVFAVRFPMILFGAAALWLTAAVGRRSLGRAGALVAVALLALHPETVLRVRQDLGPAAPELLLRVACLYAAVRYADGFERKHALVFWSLSFLGVWQKATFVWFVNAYVFAFAVCYGRPWIAAMRGRFGAMVPSLLAHAAAFAAIVAYIAYLYFGFDLPALQASQGSSYSGPWAGRLAQVGHDMTRFIEGTDSISFFQGPLRIASGGPFVAVFVGSMLIAVAAIIVTARAQRSTVSSRALLFVLAATVAVVAQMVVTAAADKPWHRLSLQPFFTLLAAHGVMVVARIAGGLAPRGRTVIAGTVALAIAGAGILHELRIQSHLAATICSPTPAVSGFARATQSNRISELLETVRSTDRRFVFLDWGMRNQALLFASEPSRAVEYLAGTLSTPDARARFVANHLHAGTRDVFVLHGPVATCFPQVREDFFGLARERAVALRKVREISEVDAAIFELWEVADRPASATSAEP